MLLRDLNDLGFLTALLACQAQPQLAGAWPFDKVGNRRLGRKACQRVCLSEHRQLGLRARMLPAELGEDKY